MKKNIIGALLLVLIGASTVFFNFNDNKTSKKEDKTITQEQTVTQIQTDPKIQEKENKNKPFSFLDYLKLVKHFHWLIHRRIEE